MVVQCFASLDLSPRVPACSQGCLPSCLRARFLLQRVRDSNIKVKDLAPLIRQCTYHLGVDTQAQSSADGRLLVLQYLEISYRCMISQEKSVKSDLIVFGNESRPPLLGDELVECKRECVTAS